MKVEFDPADLKGLEMEALRQQIFASAVQHIMTQLTPEVQQQFFTHMLGDLYNKTFGSWEWEKMFQKEALPLLETYLRQPAVRALLQQKIEEGAKAAIEKLPEIISKKIIEEQMEKLTTKLRGI